MQSVAQAWLVYRLTITTSRRRGLRIADPDIPSSPVGGTVADRYNRHRVVIATQSISMVLAFLLAILTLGHWLTVWEIIVLASLLGVVNAFDIPARNKRSWWRWWRREDLRMRSRSTRRCSTARVVGPSIAGMLMARCGEGWCFFGNAVSYIAVIIGCS